MARIIYAAAGEGFGHASRVHLIAQRFLDAGHEVMFASSHRGLLYLRQYYGEQVKEIFGLTFEYSRGYVEPIATIRKNLAQFPAGNQMNKALFEQVYRPFKPDLVITDFEPFSGWWAWYNKVPFISIDNEHMLIMCKLKHHLRNVVPRATSMLVTRLHCVGARAYVMINFFKAPLKHEAAVLAPPVVRPAVTSLQPSDAGHIVIYSTTGTHEEQLREVLGKFPSQPFYIYGFNKHEEWRNCVFKLRSTEGFLADLAAARDRRFGGAPVGATPAAWTAAPDASALPIPTALWTPSPAPAGASASGTPSPLHAEMTHDIQVVDGYVSMYMSLRNTGSEPLTFINTLYDTEPDKLWTPLVAVPFKAGGSAVVTRAGRFFPSPAIVQPGDSAVYIMGGQHLAAGQPAAGVDALAQPVINIKYCPTRGMNDVPGVPLTVEDVTWSEAGGVTTVRGTLVETLGSQRPSLPMVGAAFFDASGGFLGAVVDSRAGDAMAPHSRRPFEISGRGVRADAIARVEAYAVIQ